MAFCVQCGKQLSDADRFCAACGRAQTGATPPNPANFWANLSDNHAAMLCYIPWVGWVASIAILASAHYRGNKRLNFHAFQGLYIFVAWLLAQWFIRPIFHFGQGFPGQVVPNLVGLAVFAAWVIMLIKVNQNEDFRLPILGELADRSVSEQRS